MKISEKKLDIALAKKCMSLTDLRSDISSCTLYRVKNGEVTTKTAGRLAKILGVDITDLIETTED